MNIRDFAKICGCSYGTVTNAFKRPEKVKRDTLEKILQLAEECKYRPNHVAASLRGQTLLIGVLVYGGNSYFNMIEEGIQEELLAHGFCPLALKLNWEKRLEQIRFLIDYRVDGIIMVSPKTGLSPAEKSEVAQIRIPMVYVEPPASESMDWVNTDDMDGGRIMAEHLHGLGHRTVGVYPGDEVYLTGDRNKAFIQTAEQLGMTCIPLHETSMSTQLSACRDLSAIFCYTDAVAASLLKTLPVLGYRVPEDISVTGYADLDFADKVTPALTTIRQDGSLVGTQAGKIMINRLCHPGSAILHEIIPVSLIERESSIKRKKGQRNVKENDADEHDNSQCAIPCRHPETGGTICRADKG